MREPIRDKGRLLHIIDAIGHVLKFTAGKPLDELSKNTIEYYGIIKCIEIVGEATYKLSSQFKDAHPETPWRVIEKMRHVLVHGYYQVNPEDVYDVIRNDLQPLKVQVEQLLSSIDWDEWEKQNLDK